ncbi:hypothetical protein BDR26DRAFT_862141 [Obelidium mucronatum]|nr:hypothetical protein BDR26DRAFT_862141 [Obelidium mucronatum]
MVIMIPSIISLIYIIIELFPRGASTSPSLDSTSCLQGITDCINGVTDTNTAAAGGTRNNNTLMNVRNAAIGGVAVSFLFHLVIWKRNTLELAKAEAALISTLQKFNLDEELEGITWSYEKKADGSRVFKHFVRLSACTGAEDSMYWAGKSLATIASHDTDPGADATRLDINAQDESALRDLILEKKNSSAVHL